MAGKAIQISTRQTSPVASLDRVSELTGVLAPIRPVSMGDDMASDWLAAIIAKTAHLSDAMFREGCRVASRNCSFHTEVLKTILGANAEVEEFQRKMDAYSRPFLADHGAKRDVPAISDNREVQRLIGQAVRDCEA